MRRLRDRRPAAFFRGTELARLLTLVVMLGVLLLLIGRARDPNTWRWLAPGGGEAAKPPGEAPAGVGAHNAATEESDIDPLERDAAREELEAVSDRTPLTKEEMSAYWRLMAWQQRQSIGQLRARAEKGVSFRELFGRPQKWRGKLLKIPLHLKRAAKVDDVEDNPLGLKAVYEVFGWSDDSQPYWYWIVSSELPPGMPQGESIYEEATLLGYFLKLVSYEDRQGKAALAPLLVGRLVWHPMEDNARRDEWTWTWYLGGALAILFLVRWGLVLRGQRRPRRAGTRVASDEAVAAWLDGTQTAPRDPTDASGAKLHGEN